MVAAWMLYAAVVGALLAAGAAALDRALRARERATRLVWAAAIAGSLLLPALALWRARAPVPAAAAAPATADDAERERALRRLLDAARAQAQGAVTPQAAWHALDRPLLLAWGGASAALLVWLALAHRALARRRRAWREAAVDDARVLVAPNVGPAVVGVARPRVVLPAWALAVAPAERALMLAHEREHVRAGDPLLIAAATAAAALAPWSPAVWWQLRRLRLAVEVDCDRRVLRRHPDVRAYGGLLLDVARRAYPSTPRLAAALASPATSLERRIRIMTSRRTRRTALQAAALSAAGIALTVAACETPRPTAPRPEARAALTKITAPSADPGVALVSEERVRQELERHQPEVLRSATGQLQRVWFVVDADGKVVKSARTDGGVPSLYANSISAVEIVKLPKGRVAPDSVAVIWVSLKRPGSPGPVSVRGAGMTLTGDRITHLDGGMVAIASGGAPASGAPASGAAPVAVRVRDAAKPQPLYVLDGREVPAADARGVLASMDHASIESVEVLKGAAAAARYGDRARDGVVLITTKGGARPTTRDY